MVRVIIYADLFVAWRDVDGVPILSETFWEVGTTTPSVEVTCVQPISYAPDPDGLMPMVTNRCGRTRRLPRPARRGGFDRRTLLSKPTRPATRSRHYLDFVSEVELERLNLVRTSDAVLWKKLVDVGTRLAGATKITLDGAGRITTWTGIPSHPRSTHPPIRPPSTLRQKGTPRRPLRQQTASPERGNQVA